MKKFCLILAALLLFALLPGFTAYADGEEAETSTLDYVTDVADVLSYQEWDDLQLRCEQMTADHGCQILIVTWDDLEGDFTDVGFCEALFDWYDVGVGADRSCIMLMVSLKEDYCCIFTNGFGSISLDDTAKADLVSTVRSELSWADSFNAYLDKCAEYLTAARGGGTRDAASAAAEAPASLDYVADSAQLLTEDQRAELNRRAAGLTEKYGIAVRIITVNSIGQYNVEDFAEAVFDQYGLGYGPQNSCIMLLLSMEYRDYDIMAHGYGNEAFTDYGKDKLADKFLPKLGNNDWYGGFSAYLDGVDEFLALAAQGEPVDVGSGYGGPSQGAKTVIHLVVAFIPALIVALIMKGKMKTVKKQRAAAAYTGLDQLDLRLKEDRFLHRSQTRTRIQTESSSRSGGGTSVNSHGSSHHSGKF